MIATRLSVKYNKPYSFLPYSYRYDDHSEYEKVLNYTNNGEFKKILIITDVVLNEVSMEQIVFSTVEEQHREAKIVIREPSAVLREDLQAYTNKKVRVQIRSTGGVGEVITATTIDKWWPLAN